MCLFFPDLSKRCYQPLKSVNQCEVCVDYPCLVSAVWAQSEWWLLLVSVCWPEESGVFNVKIRAKKGGSQAGSLVNSILFTCTSSNICAMSYHLLTSLIENISNQFKMKYCFASSPHPLPPPGRSSLQAVLLCSKVIRKWVSAVISRSGPASVSLHL